MLSVLPNYLEIFGSNNVKNPAYVQDVLSTIYQQQQTNKYLCALYFWYATNFFILAFIYFCFFLAFFLVVKRHSILKYTYFSFFFFFLVQNFSNDATRNNRQIFKNKISQFHAHFTLVKCNGTMLHRISISG